MVGYFIKNRSIDDLLDEAHFRQLAIDLSNESIANFRKELDKMKD